MQCPICSSEIPSGSVVCDKCGARRVTGRTPIGVIVGWAGLTVAILWGILWLFLLALLGIGHDTGGFPWVTLFIGTVIAAALLYYSRTTIHTTWKRRDE